MEKPRNFQKKSHPETFKRNHTEKLSKKKNHADKLLKKSCDDEDEKWKSQWKATEKIQV